jgi:hypothetical protein
VKKSNEQDIGSALKEFFRSYRIDSKVKEVQISEVWEKVMGATMARYTQDIRLKNGILQIRVSSAPLKNELTYNRNEMINRLNEEFGETVIKEIKIY